MAAGSDRGACRGSIRASPSAACSGRSRWGRRRRQSAQRTTIPAVVDCGGPASAGRGASGSSVAVAPGGLVERGTRPSRRCARGTSAASACRRRLHLHAGSTSISNTSVPLPPRTPSGSPASTSCADPAAAFEARVVELRVPGAVELVIRRRSARFWLSKPTLVLLLIMPPLDRHGIDDVAGGRA